MSRVFVGLLVSTILPKFGTQQNLNLDQSIQYANIHGKFKTEDQISDKFDKPSAVRLKNHSPRDTYSSHVYECKPIKGCKDLNEYKIFSNDWQSDRLRSDYEVWNLATFHAPQSDTKIQRLSKRNPESVARSEARYMMLADSPENGPYVLDDDYSLMNYIDNWRGLDPDHKMQRFHRKSEKKLEAKKHHPKRELEFQVEFHSTRKDNEYRRKLLSSDKTINEGRGKSSMNHRMVKSCYRSKYDRSYGHIKTEKNPYKPKYSAFKKKRLTWGRKRAKVYPKLGPQSRFLDVLETSSRSNEAAMGHVWHWATMRNLAMAAITPRKDYATPHQEMGIMPQAFIPVMNLSDSVRKSLEEKINQAQKRPLEFQNVPFARKFVPQHAPPPNLRNGLPTNREVALALKPVLNQNSGNPTRQPSVFFNRPTQFINSYENHYENFKNTPFWNARQGPPGPTGVLGSPVRFSNFRRFNIAPHVMRNGQFIKPSLSLPGFFENIKEDPGTDKFNKSRKIQKFKALPGTKQEPVIPTKPTPKVFETADIVNLLQSALLPQTIKAATTTEETLSALLPKSIPLEKMLDMIVPSGSTSISISKSPTQSPTEDAVRLVTEEPKLIVDATKEALLSLFTTEEPMMESLEDILRRNTDRKIPIVYDIEDAPQLSPPKSSQNTENPTTNIPKSQDEHLTEPKSHILNRRGLLKKNQTSLKHKTVQRTGSANTTLTTPWIVLATTENMLYSEILEMERHKLNNTRKSKTRKGTSRSKVNLLFKNKSKSIETTNKTTNEPPKATEEPNVKSRRDVKAVTSSRSGKSNYEPATSDLGCEKCQCGCHTTPRPTSCCRCREKPPLELTTKVACCPASQSKGSISCPDCHQEFTYKLGLRPLINC